MDPETPASSPWRRLKRDAVTLLLIAVYCAIAAPTVATVLLALRANGLSVELALSVILAPLAILLSGVGVFVLGLVFGWMLVALVRMGVNTLASRLGLAVLVASVAWWLAEPLPVDGAAVASDAGAAVVEWLIWSTSAAVSALVFTRRWLAHRVTGGGEDA